VLSAVDTTSVSSAAISEPMPVNATTHPVLVLIVNSFADLLCHLLRSRGAGGSIAARISVAEGGQYERVDDSVRDRLRRASERAAAAAERTARAHEAAADQHERHAEAAEDIGVSVEDAHRAREEAQRIRAQVELDRAIAERERAIARGQEP